MEGNKDLVQRLVMQVINSDDLTVLDDICTPRLARKLRAWFAPFRAAFPDWRQEIVKMVAEGDTVVARFVCRGTNLGEWLGVPPTGRSVAVDEVYFFTVVDGRLDQAWGLEDTWGRLRQLGTAEEAVRALRRDRG